MELLDMLASQRVLMAMITPAVLISACGTLIFSTSGRLGRLFDRVNALKGELEGVLTGKLCLPEQRIAYIKKQMTLQKRRALLIQRAMAALYTATLLFISSSLIIAITEAMGMQSWLATVIAMAGGLFLFAASALLLFESRYNLAFINHHIDFISSLQEHADGKRP
ncbi:MAG: DUF2721 domain-containing protein [Geobacter sp.]|nr:DUF2721 domain-containing protein [Geobacter sp.]